MSTPTRGRFVTLLFGAFVLYSVLFAFGLGYQTRKWTEPKLSWDQPTPDQHAALGEHLRRSAQRIREDERVLLCQAVERHKEQAPIEQHAAIDDCLRVMRECRAKWAKQPSVVQAFADGK